MLDGYKEIDGFPNYYINKDVKLYQLGIKRFKLFTKD